MTSSGYDEKRMQDLKDVVALVTGASRGLGRATAVALGERGATVYVTGRSQRQRRHPEDLPGSVEETADEVAARGGQGISAVCNHTLDTDIDLLIERIRREQGRLDVLVNNVWGGYEYHDLAEFQKPFWEQPLRHWDGMFTAGVRAHLVTSRAAARLLFESDLGLIVSTTAWDQDKYLGNLFYDVAKASIHRMVFGMARELRTRNVAAVAVAPGFMRTERVLAAHEKEPFDLSRTETPAYAGRVIAALAADPGRMRWSGQVLAAATLAREYGVTDVNGTQPPPFDIGPG